MPRKPDAVKEALAAVQAAQAAPDNEASKHVLTERSRASRPSSWGRRRR